MRRTLLIAALVAASLGSSAGCPEDGGGFNFGGLFSNVRVEIVNDTNFAVAPNILFDDDSGFLASLAPADSLATGLVQPGDLVVFNFDCDELGLILADDAEQVSAEFGSFFADDTDTLEREEEYDCGDTIRFRFFGDLADFGVVVSVNNRVVD